MNDHLRNRSFVIAGIFIAFILIYIIKLFSLQIIEDKYKKGADSNAFLNKTIFPPRGLIYDRNDSLLVYNKSAYDVNFIHREIVDFDTLSFCRDLDITVEYFNERMKEVKSMVGYSPFRPQTLMSQMEMEQIATVQQSIYKYPGFYIQARTLREYRYNVGGHVLGSIGEVTPSMIEKDDYNDPGDYVGREGLEYTYEKDLRGVKGVEVLLRDARGMIQGSYADGANNKAPIAGKDLKTTLDIELQILGEELLNGKMGSVVAIEPETGEILAMVSNPTFSPSLLVGRQRSKNYNMLVQDPLKPLYNRATQATYSPGSTFKVFQAAVGLHLGGITEETRFYCNGPASSPIRCSHFHGSSINFLNAIQESCNPYFWQTFRNTIEKNGYGKDNKLYKDAYNDWREAIMSFGFGDRFEDGDLYQQSTGLIPSVEYYNKFHGETGWRALTIRSLSIGQGEILVTPLQLANATAVIANKGYYISPHLNKADSLLQYKHDTGINKDYFNLIEEGMWRVIESGTGRRWKIPGISSCGKTGTVENSRGKDHAFFIGYAPRENPKIVVACVIENAGFGGTWAAPVASFMMEYYIKRKIDASRISIKENYSKSVTNPNARQY